MKTKCLTCGGSGRLDYSPTDYAIGPTGAPIWCGECKGSGVADFKPADAERLAWIFRRIDGEEKGRA